MTDWGLLCLAIGLAIGLRGLGAGIADMGDEFRRGLEALAEAIREGEFE